MIMTDSISSNEFKTGKKKTGKEEPFNFDKMERGFLSELMSYLNEKIIKSYFYIFTKEAFYEEEFGSDGVDENSMQRRKDKETVMKYFSYIFEKLMRERINKKDEKFKLLKDREQDLFKYYKEVFKSIPVEGDIAFPFQSNGWNSINMMVNKDLMGNNENLPEYEINGEKKKVKLEHKKYFTLDFPSEPLICMEKIDNFREIIKKVTVKLTEIAKNSKQNITLKFPDALEQCYTFRHGLVIHCPENLGEIISEEINGIFADNGFPLKSIKKGFYKEGDDVAIFSGKNKFELLNSFTKMHSTLLSVELYKYLETLSILDITTLEDKDLQQWIFNKSEELLNNKDVQRMCEILTDPIGSL